MDSVEAQAWNRFIVMGNRSMIVANWRWWIDNEPEIEAWMDANITNGRLCRTGMIIEFDSQDDFLLFLLTWQGGPKET